MIIMKKNVKESKKNNTFQNTYNMINSIFPAISMLSILLGGVTVFVYLRTINHVELFSSFTVSEFVAISLLWFVLFLYAWIFSHTLSFINFFMLEGKGNGDINKKSNLFILLYILNLVSFLLLIRHFCLLKESDLSFYSSWFNPVLIAFIYLCLSTYFYKNLSKYYPYSFPIRILIHMGVSAYPTIFIFISLYLICRASHNDTSYYILCMTFFLVFSSVIGNKITMDLKDRKFKHALPKAFSSIMLTMLFLSIPSQIFNTNFSYTLFSILGKADKVAKPYIIDANFISKQGLTLNNLVHENSVYCVKLMFNSGDKYIFTDDKKSPSENSRYYEIPSKSIDLYQGDIKCE